MNNGYLIIAIVFLLTLALTVIIESMIYPILKRKAKQPIYNEGPSWHMTKSGTPTMGGVAFVLAISVSLLLASMLLISLDKNSKSGVSILITLLFSIGNSLVGIFDDLMKLHRNKNGGLTPMQKILLQFLLSVLFLMARKHFLNDTETLKLPFANIDLGLIYYPFAMIILLGIINCANLTDGIDGLASCTALTIAGVFFTLGSELGAELPFLSSAILGGVLGFLFFNAHPAKIFMGDTGSLFLGALTVCLGFSAKNMLLIIPIGIVYVIEGVSVILQVAVYKLTKKRILKMAPLHHHLEKCGIDENRICVSAVILTLFCSSVLLTVMGVCK